jgi:hypothetical protein
MVHRGSARYRWPGRSQADASRRHQEAAKHFQNANHAHAAHQAQIAYAHARRAIFNSDEAAWSDVLQ